ncbi:MAG: hypothetical protein M1383_01545 [Patescibacteria group bacterium]|nr:hypothetical protein [Patescibacteria group bacterium]
MQFRIIAGWAGLGLTFIKPLIGTITAYWVVYSPLRAGMGIALIALLDICDGVVFRLSPFASNRRIAMIRRLADAIGDRMVVQGVLLVMVFKAGFPLWVYAAATLVQATVTVLVPFSHIIKRPIWKPSPASRIGGVALAAAAITWLVADPVTSTICAGIMAVFGGLGICQYCQMIVTQKRV